MVLRPCETILMPGRPLLYSGEFRSGWLSKKEVLVQQLERVLLLCSLDVAVSTMGLSWT